MSVSKFKKAKIERVKKEAINLYKQGYSLRQVAAALGLSHTQIWYYINEFEGVDKSKHTT